MPGLVPVNLLTNDHYYFNRGSQKLIGRRTRTMFSIGQKIEVIISRVDFRKRFLDFVPTELGA